jgi:hypothetical protein
LSQRIESLLYSSGDERLASKMNLDSKFKTSKIIYPELQVFSDDDLKVLRVTRNTFEHRGFSPRDDSESVRIILRIALPYFIRCCGSVQNYDFNEDVLYEIREHFEVSRAALESAPSGADLSFCFDAFRHFMRLYFSEFSLRDEPHSSFRDSEEYWAFVERRAKQIENEFAPEWRFTCPLCDRPDGVVCKLNEETLHNGVVEIEQMMCSDCEFTLNRNSRTLANILMKKDIEEQRDRILTGYGIAK